MTQQDIGDQRRHVYPGDGLQGIVIAVQANYYWVKLNLMLGYDELPLLLCTRRSRLKKIGQRVMVGDRVLVEEPDWESRRGAICQVLTRVSELDRPPVATRHPRLVPRWVRCAGNHRRIRSHQDHGASCRKGRHRELG